MAINRNRHPTARKILARPIRLKPAAVRALRQWKASHKGRLRSVDALDALLQTLAGIYRKPVNVAFGGVSCYWHGSRLIMLDRRRLSITTALHEFAHHAFGGSELKACRWSIALFGRAFPRSLRACEIKGHYLRRMAS
jgi:hypothetical protein